MDESEREIRSLKDELGRSTDDAERAGIIDAIGIQLARAGRFEEALAENARAVGLRERLAARDRELIPYLAASLSNRGGYLTKLGRYPEALSVHTRAFELYSQYSDPEGPNLWALGYNAERMSALLSELAAPSLSAKFAGMALDFFMTAANQGALDAGRVREQLGYFAQSIDAVTSTGDGELPAAQVDAEHLEALATSSSWSAGLLGQRADRELLDGRTDAAIADATRVVGYCELFGPELSSPLRSVCAENYAKLATWSMASGDHGVAIAAGRNAIKLFGQQLDFGKFYAQFAEANCVVGLLSVREEPLVAIASLDLALARYEALTIQDRRRFLPRLAACLQYLYVIHSWRGDGTSASMVRTRMRPLYKEMRRSRQRFEDVSKLVRQRRLLLCAELAATDTDHSRDLMRICAEVGRLTELAARSDQAASTPTTGLHDPRLWCCSGRQLSRLIGDLADRGMGSSDVHTLGRRLRECSMYPARDLGHRCEQRYPQIFITYTWSENFVDLQEAIWSALDHVGGLIRRVRPHLDDGTIEELIGDKLGIWLDFIFIDQAARDVVSEVREVLPTVIEECDLHFVLSDAALLRSWCCYELALFNRRAPTEESGSRTLRSFVAPSAKLEYQGFARTSTTDPGDKHAIEDSIRDIYPGGLTAAELLLVQASMLSDPFVTSGFAQFGAAEQLVELCIDKWLRL